MEKNRYTDEELAEFDVRLDQEIEKAKADLQLLESGLEGKTDMRESLSQSEGEYALTLEDARQLKLRQEKYLGHLMDAKARIRNKTYGVCRVTGVLISKERLKVVPHATLSIEAKASKL